MKTIESDCLMERSTTMMSGKLEILGVVLINILGLQCNSWKEPRRPKLEIPVTYNIGWWPDNNRLTIDSLKIDIIESNLNLFNSKSLISYKVSMSFDDVANFKPVVYQVHLSERINNDTTLNCDRIIEITPVMMLKENKKLKGVTCTFEFKNEYLLSSNQWGSNRIKFICGQQERIIELHQRK